MPSWDDVQMDETENSGPYLDRYVFAVNERPFCCWEADLADRNVRFLSGLDANYYSQIAESLGSQLEGESKLSASIALRGAYHQAVETLFSLLGAHVQAPSAVAAWLTNCRTEDLENVVMAFRNGEQLLTQRGRRKVELSELARYVLRNCWVDEEQVDSTSARFARLWNRLSKDFLDDQLRAEYNAIKHGLRVSSGGFTLSIGIEEECGQAAPPESMRSIGGSIYGSSFLQREKVGSSSHHIRARWVSLNWSAEAMVQRLSLISMSISNVIGSLLIENGASPESVKFVRPVQPEAFEAAWSHHVGVAFSSVDSVVQIGSEHEVSREKLLQELEARG
jgi:hypothetical protein